PVVRLLRYGKGYIAVLCAPCRALNTNDIAAQYRQVISGRLLTHVLVKPVMIKVLAQAQYFSTISKNTRYYRK
ncbi:MAG: hypothetical protein U9P00_13325, partial [Pseudomonadota bacterium]|nr:hypothetical protein [Pseudomonadota bacterium]